MGGEQGRSSSGDRTQINLFKVVLKSLKLFNTTLNKLIWADDAVEQRKFPLLFPEITTESPFVHNIENRFMINFNQTKSKSKTLYLSNVPTWYTAFFFD